MVVGAGSHDYDKVISLSIGEGRYFTASESAAGRPVAVIGHQVAMQLFGRRDCVGSTLKVQGTKIRVIGVLEEQAKAWCPRVG